MHKKSLPHIPLEARQALSEAVKRSDGIAELELLGLPVHTIAVLEQSDYEFVYLEEILQVSPYDLLGISNFSWLSLYQLFTALSRYHELPRLKEQRERKLLSRAEQFRFTDPNEPRPLPDPAHPLPEPHIQLRRTVVAAP